MCRSTGYYEPREDVAKKVVDSMFERNERSLMVYYLRMAYQDDQHTYMNDLRWVLDNKFEDIDLEQVKEQNSPGSAAENTSEAAGYRQVVQGVGQSKPKQRVIQPGWQRSRVSHSRNKQPSRRL